MSSHEAMAARGSGGVDRISVLPDDLLHSILIRLRCAAAAVRTSLLSRRWRRVWVHLPELHLFYYGKFSPAQAQDRVDAVLDAFSSPTTFERIEITMPYAYRSTPSPRRVPARRLSRWLRFASQRLAGSLDLMLPIGTDGDDVDDEAVLIPLCERATSVFLNLCNHKLRIQVLPTGGALFTALVTLKISRAHMDSRELEHTISSRCPSLKKLDLEHINLLRNGAPGLSIRSDSLEKLNISIKGWWVKKKLGILAPKLQTLSSFFHAQAHVDAPMLSELHWTGHSYDPLRHHIMETRRHLRRLQISTSSSAGKLMQRFDNVDELSLDVSGLQGVPRYERFISDISKLSRCRILVVKLFSFTYHAIEPTMICLLRNCVGVRKIVVHYFASSTDYNPCNTATGCPCTKPESRKIESIFLDSLEEVEVKGHGEIDRKIQCVKLLYNLCRKSRSQKRVAITISESKRIEYVRQKINNICPSNNEVTVTIQSR